MADALDTLLTTTSYIQADVMTGQIQEKTAYLQHENCTLQSGPFHLLGQQADSTGIVMQAADHADAAEPCVPHHP